MRNNKINQSQRANGPTSTTADLNFAILGDLASFLALFWSCFLLDSCFFSASPKNDPQSLRQVVTTITQFSSIGSCYSEAMGGAAISTKPKHVQIQVQVSSFLLLLPDSNSNLQHQQQLLQHCSACNTAATAQST